jgi:hypothetical protein
MIGDLIFFIFTKMIEAVSFILPAFSLWPQTLIDGIGYFFASLMKFNIFFPIGTGIDALVFFLDFSAVYLTAKLSIKVVSFMRGSNALDI